jgi:BNR repeat protein
MSARRITSLFVTAVAVAVLLTAVLVSRPSTVGVNGSPGRGGAEELQEQKETTELRLEALRDARAAGLFGAPEVIRGEPAPGWAGEELMNPRTDDWEPAIAADPNDPFVYLITTRYGEPKPCPGNCPIPHIALEISKDGGKTWSDGRALCACKGSGQFDPLIEVVPDTGDVYAMFMIGFNVVFIKSTDHGKTWTDPVSTWGNVSWNDKPAFATSDDGEDVYVSWNGPTGGDLWVAQSHDFGESWTQTKLVDSRRYYFAFDADVTSDGTVIFSESSFDYSGPAASAVGNVRHYAVISRNVGDIWKVKQLDSVELGEPCVSEGCYADFYSGRNSVTADEDGDLVFVYDGATTPGGPQRIWVRRSTDSGASWSNRSRISRSSAHASSPATEATGNGDVRAWYYERPTGGDGWNVWFRSSDDLGATWSSPKKLSDATSGARYKSAAGFDEIYGDYGEVSITNTGKTIATWGEGFSWNGPGGTWFNRQR